MLKLIDFLFYNFLLMNMLNVYSFKSPYPVIIQPQSGWSMEEWMKGRLPKDLVKIPSQNAVEFVE